jgi:predicted RecB family nuclease
MKNSKNHIIYSPSDLANFINCKHLTELEKKKARKEIDEPEMRYNPSLEALKEKGIAFEQDHLAELKAKGLDIVEIDGENRTKAEQNTLEAMHRGADVIYQARLKTDRWAGWGDFMIKTDKKSELGDWSYEVWDTKLATNTKAGNLLQIGLYTQRIAEIQGQDPEFMGVIKPDGKEIFRYHDYAAYIRLVQQRLEEALLTDADTYPQPVSHCDICKWWKLCNAQRRADDHLTFVAGMGKSQIVELRQQNIDTLAKLAELPNPVPFDPEKGSQHVYNKLTDQASIQLESRNDDFKPLHEILPLEEGRGFYILPEPSEHDIYLDLEGARMVEPDGLEYITRMSILPFGQKTSRRS